jgi:hypothetical protein
MGPLMLRTHARAIPGDAPDMSGGCSVFGRAALASQPAQRPRGGLGDRTQAVRKIEPLLGCQVRGHTLD